MAPTLLIAAKDARLRLRDRSLFLYGLAIPLGLVFVFSLIFSNVDGDSEVFRYGVVDEDQGAMAATFTDEILPAVEEEGTIAVEPVPTAEDGRRLVTDGELAAVFVVPSGFSDAVESGRTATLEVIGDVDSTFGAQVARAIAGSYTAELTGVRLAVATATADQPADQQRMGELTRRATGTPAPVTLTETDADRRELDTTTFFSAGMAVFFLFFTVQFGVSSLLDERRDGTMARLLAAPVRRVGVLGGKVLVSFGVGVLSMGILAVATTVLLGADWGDPLGVAALVTAGVLAATGVMALVASLARTAEQAGNWQAMIAVVMGVLGGAFFPVAQVGGALAAISYLTPHRWFMQGLADLSGGGGREVVLLPVAGMLAFAVVAGGVALLRTSKLVQP